MRSGELDGGGERADWSAELFWKGGVACGWKEEGR
jgi:hypothetical protein